jgi:hypothetical protein
MIQPCVRLKLRASRDLASSVKPVDESATGAFVIFSVPSLIVKSEKTNCRRNTRFPSSVDRYGYVHLLATADGWGG